MEATSKSSRHRRMSAPPSPLPREIPREELVEILQSRFDRPATLVVAGAGFGKTTALAQATRANLAAPVGVDVWVTLEATDEDDQRLASAVVNGLETARSDSTPTPSGEALDMVLDAIVGMAPVDVCLLFDDLHKIPHGSAGDRLIAGLLAELPANGHVVLSSRRQPRIPLARLRASADVGEIGEGELSFTADEAASLAVLHDGQSAVPSGTGGWPALVALSLSTSRQVAIDFLWEEIVADLDPATRRALLAMSILGSGSFDEAIAVSEGRADVADVRRVLRSVPLISGDSVEGTFRVHDLWEEQIGELFQADELDSVRRSARAMMIERGETLRLGSMALRWGDDTGLLHAAQALVAESLINLPIETGRRWLAAAPPGLRDEPELRLLLLAVEVAERPDDPTIDLLADDVIETLYSRADFDQVISATTLAMTAAHRRGDLGRVFGLAERARAELGNQDSPTLRLAFGGVEATIAYLGEGADAALGILESHSLEGAPAAFADFFKAIRANWLLEVGRAEEAVEVINSVEAPDPSVAEFAAYIGWHAGDSAQFAGRTLELGDLDSVDSRRWFIRCAETAEIAASLGETTTARAARTELAPYVGSEAGALYSGSAAAAMAKAYILEHDERAARSILDAHLADFPIDDPIGDLQLRRRFATCYLVHDGLRHHWDAADLGPRHDRIRAVARTLLQARSGQLAPDSVVDDPQLVITALPLPWSVELAVAACRDDARWGTELVDALTAHALSPLRSELRFLSAEGERSLARTAADLLTELPHEDGPVVRIGVLGPMAIGSPGEQIVRPELRRARVRTVLALLLVRGPLRRDELIEFVWPERDPQRARQNLRTTLTYLRRVLEPADGDEDQPVRLRTDGDRISVAEQAAVEVDLWEFRRLVAEADRAATARGENAIELLRQAVALWRGDPLPDLQTIVGMEADVEQIRSELVDTSHRLGELLVTVGRFDEALRCADRTREVAPFSERAHRLAISALLQLKDRDRLRLRVAALGQMLDELEVEPEDTTSMLLARANNFIGAAGRQ